MSRPEYTSLQGLRAEPVCRPAILDAYKAMPDGTAYAVIGYTLLR
jgi:hypothetical protein